MRRSVLLLAVVLAGCLAPGPWVDDAGTSVDAGDGRLDGGTRTPRIPELRPITRAQAEALGAYACRLKVNFFASTDSPMAWSLINLQCTDRAQAVSYALAAADPSSLGADPAPLRAAEVTDARMGQLVTTPTFDSGRIWVYGPLITTQTLLRPSAAVLRTDEHYWPFHVATVVNVEGTFEVLDLSVGDAPLPIAQWLSGFVAPGVACALFDEDDILDHWVYWMQASGAVPGWRSGQPVPEPPCSYHFTPLFQGRWDLPPLDGPGARTLAESMSNQSQVMRAMLEGTGVPDQEIPFLRSTYQARSVDWMCAQYGNAMGFPLCAQ
jgi:hypothetical protein